MSYNVNLMWGQTCCLEDTRVRRYDRLSDGNDMKGRLGSGEGRENRRDWTGVGDEKRSTEKDRETRDIILSFFCKGGGGGYCIRIVKT